MIFDNLFKKPKKVGLALSGGGVRGIAHVGVLKVLQENKIPIDFIAGTSSGALIGAIYAAGMTIAEMLEIVKGVGWGIFARINLIKTGLVTSRVLEDFVRSIIGEIQFSQLKIPFAAVTTDLRTGRKVILREGSVAKAVRASCAFPGLYTPVSLDEYLLADGAVVENLPIATVKGLGAEYVIGADVIPKLILKKGPHNMVEVGDRAIDLVLKSLSRLCYSQADCILEPIAERITSFEIEKKQLLVELGVKAALEKLSQLKEQI